MKIGTRSVLIGAHCFFVHPWFVAWGWWKLYGFPLDPRLWLAFFVHDLGYIGKPNMDGPEGEDHVLFGAKLMSTFFGVDWYLFSLLHSRYYAKRMGMKPSRLCAADKMAIALTPWWLYIPMVRLTGEIREYKAVEKHREEHGDWEAATWRDDRLWFKSLQGSMEKWAIENKERCTRITPEPSHHQSFGD